MKQNPLVSIIIGTYNREKHIKKALESALNQNYDNIEIIVVDDGSSDNTKQILEPYINQRKIKYIYQKNSGSMITRNTGINASQGKYTAVLDSDDFYSDSQKIEKQVIFLENNPDYVLCGGGAIVIDDSERELFRYLFPKKDENIRKLILFESPFAHSNVLYKKSTWQKAGRYNQDLKYAGDWDMWLRLGKLGKLYNFQEYFITYLQPQENKHNQNIRRNIDFNHQIRKRYKNDYPAYFKASLFGWAHYFYSYLPFKKLLYPLLSKIKKLILPVSIKKY